jgi:hypothetical protein
MAHAESLTENASNIFNLFLPLGKFIFVMAGLVRAIHVFPAEVKPVGGCPGQAGHDERSQAAF